MKFNQKDCFPEFVNNMIRLSFIFLLFFLLFGIFRASLLTFFEDITDLLYNKKNILRAFSMGLRFDTVCIVFGTTPVFFVFLLGLFFNKSNKYKKFSFHFSAVYITVLFTLFLFVEIVDFFFYKYFGVHIDIAVFGFWEDNTSALMKTFWTDYPVIPVFLGLLIFIVCFYFLIKKILSLKFTVPNFPTWSKVIVVVLLIGFFFFGGRGFFLFGRPLQTKDTIITTNKRINALIPNGIFTLKDACLEKKRQEITINIDKIVKESGFSSMAEIVGYYVNREVPNREDSLKNALYAQTRENSFLKENPPHVVFIMTEGLGLNLFRCHHKEKLNVLGELEDVLPEAYLFENFISSTQLTINSLEAIMVNNTFGMPITQSAFAGDSLTSSVAYVFKQAGYETNFVTSGNLDWRNLNLFIPRQYFDKVIDSQNLGELFPEAEENEWGCFDEYMFDYIYEELEKNITRPQFVFGQTTTNHTPFHTPKSYTPYTVDIKTIRRKILFDDELAESHFKTYQYANDCLGKLIKKIRASKNGDKTIIVVTGDHCVRGLFNYENTEIPIKYGVPLLLFIPDKYKPQNKNALNNFGSHKDIFPTIFNLSLSNAKYVKSGVDLFSDEAAGNFALHHSGILLGKNGAVDFSQKPIYFVWNPIGNLEVSEQTGALLNEDMKRAKALMACMRYYNLTEWKKRRNIEF